MYEGQEFLMKKGNAKLTIYLSEVADQAIEFQKVRWHQFTALYNCNVELMEGAYFRLVEEENSVRLKQFVTDDRAPRKAYRELHHYHIFLDETGCHELFAESATIF